MREQAPSGRASLWGWQDLVSPGVYAIFTLGFFWQVVFCGALVPRGGGDLASFLYPVYSFAAQSLQTGVIPFWNPHLYGGSPFAADMQSGLFYPVNLVAFLLFRPFTYGAMEALALFHYWLAASLTYVYCRGLGLGRLAAFGGGVVFAFSGFMVAHLGHLNMIAAASWLPLILFLFHRAAVDGRLLWAALAGLAYGTSLLAGHLQVSLYLALFLGFYWLWALLAGGAEGRWRRLLSLPLAYVVALGATALWFVPAAQLVGHSLRAELTYGRAIEFSASPLGLITFVVPHFFGDHAGNYWGIRGSLTEAYGYAGLLPLLLAPLALMVSHRRPRMYLDARWFFAAAAVLFLLLALGESTVLYGWVWRFVPGFDKVRAPGRFLLLVDFSLAVLSAYGLEAMGRRLLRRERPRFRLVLMAAGAALGGLALIAVPFFYHALLTSQDKDPIIFKRVALALESLNLTVALLALAFLLLIYYRYGRRRGLLPYLALALIALDLYSANAAFNPTDEDLIRAFRHPQVAAFLKAHGEPLRIDSVTDIWHAWQPNTSLLEGIDDVMGIFNPMMLADYERYWGSLGSRSVPGYDLLNARYVIAPKDVVLDWTKFMPVVTDAPGVNVYENIKVLPRAMVVPRSEVMARDDMLARLRSSAFDPREVVLLEPGAAVVNGGGGGVTAWRRSSPNDIAMAVDSPQGGYLLQSEVFYPGWRAYLDGQEVALLRADYIFQAVALPPGSHELRLVFRPQRWEVVFLVSIATWMAVAAAATLALIRRLRVAIRDR